MLEYCIYGVRRSSFAIRYPCRIIVLFKAEKQTGENRIQNGRKSTLPKARIRSGEAGHIFVYCPFWPEVDGFFCIWGQRLATLAPPATTYEIQKRLYREGGSENPGSHCLCLARTQRPVMSFCHSSKRRVYYPYFAAFTNVSNVVMTEHGVFCEPFAESPTHSSSRRGKRHTKLQVGW